MIEESPQAVSVETRRAALQNEIGAYVRNGYHVVSQTDTTAQLIKPKQFGMIWFLAWLFLTFFGAFFYVLYHASIKKEGQAYLQVDELGVVHRS